jgi:hypothetical protein
VNPSAALYPFEHYVVSSHSALPLCDLNGYFTSHD